MASRRKAFQPKRQISTNEQLHYEFLIELMSGEIKAIKLHVKERGNSGKYDFEYDDPDG